MSIGSSKCTVQAAGSAIIDPISENCMDKIVRCSPLRPSQSSLESYCWRSPSKEQTCSTQVGGCEGRPSAEGIKHQKLGGRRFASMKLDIPSPILQIWLRFEQLTAKSYRTGQFAKYHPSRKDTRALFGFMNYEFNIHTHT